jgi:prepilin-type N-terminal cleavage/methylation domain-containing protein/prepilin-type processing-associated H-X9-DG protein
MSRIKPNRRPGFTLIELLVVVAIIGVLVALLLPAVQKVREAANRVTCANNLRQIALALHNYESTNGYFPASNTSGPAKRHSWMTFLLPYIEQQTVYQGYNINKNWYAPSNRKPVMAQFKIYQCPSTPDHNRVDAAYPTQPACGDYNAIKGVSPELVAIGLVSGTNLQGVLVKNMNTRIADITDGTSNTIMVAEDAGRPELWTAGLQVAGASTVGGAWADDQGPFFLNGSSYDGTNALGPCAINCTNDKEVYSFHGQGANVIFADGSVQFLRSSINIQVMAALVTSQGGEPVSVGDY